MNGWAILVPSLRDSPNKIAVRDSLNAQRPRQMIVAAFRFVELKCPAAFALATTGLALTSYLTWNCTVCVTGSFVALKFKAYVPVA